MTPVDKELQVHWANIAPLLCIRNEREYNAAIKRLNELSDEIGSQGVASEILSGKRELNIRRIRSLAQRFGVSSAVFV